MVQVDSENLAMVQVDLESLAMVGIDHMKAVSRMAAQLGWGMTVEAMKEVKKHTEEEEVEEEEEPLPHEHPLIHHDPHIGLHQTRISNPQLRRGDRPLCSHSHVELWCCHWSNGLCHHH